MSGIRSIRVGAVVAEEVLAAARRGFPAAAAAAAEGDLLFARAHSSLQVNERTAKTRRRPTGGSRSSIVTRSKFEGADYQSNIAFQLSRTLRLPPHEVAEEITRQLASTPLQRATAAADDDDATPTSSLNGCQPIESAEVSGKGFLNISLCPHWLSECANVLAENLVESASDTPSGSSPSRRLDPAPPSTAAAAASSATEETQTTRVLVDFASPNMCKALHVGHLRSAIIGDSLCRVLEFLGHNVDRVSHVGDWGTPMGMVLAHLHERPDEYPWAQATPLQMLRDPTSRLPMDAKQLGQIYAEAKRRFDSDPGFVARVSDVVQELQQSSAEDDGILGSVRHTWQVVCEMSRRSFSELFEQLGVRGLEERGESTYHSILPSVVAELQRVSKFQLEGRRHRNDDDDDTGGHGDGGDGATEDTSELLQFEISDGASCIFLNGRDKPPTIVQKRDGSYLYATTDLAALKQRIEAGYDRLLYVVDHAQSWHFEQVFEIAKRAGWLDPSKTEVHHVPFGLILGADGRKMSSRDGGTPLLSDLLDSAYDAALRHTLLRDGQPAETSDGNDSNDESRQEEEARRLASLDVSKSTHQQRAVARVLGAGALRFFDLSHALATDYSFAPDALLSSGSGVRNSCVRVLYAYGRLTQLLRAAETRDAGQGPDPSDYCSATSGEPAELEKELLVHVAAFPEVVEAAAATCQLNGLCDYLLTTASTFHKFYGMERVLGHPRQAQRLAMCRAARAVLGTGLFLVGVETLERV